MTGCIECGEKNKKLLNHHVSYEPEETVKLCYSCHRKVHWDSEHELYTEKPTDKTMIPVSKEVRQKLKSCGTKGMTYDEIYKLERTCDRLNYTIENLEDILSLIENKKTEDG